MRKLLNDPNDFVDEILEGLILASGGTLRAAEGEPRAIVRAGVDFAGRVTVATGGGSGHLPLFVGFVGPGRADGCYVGNLFAAPSAEEMLAVTQAIDGGCGVLYLYGNYGGDRLNFDLAAELAGAHGIEVRSVLAADDVASASPENASRRRGIAGIALAYMIAGASAATGVDLDTVAVVTQLAAARTRSIGVTCRERPCPQSGTPTSTCPRERWRSA